MRDIPLSYHDCLATQLPIHPQIQKHCLPAAVFNASFQTCAKTQTLWISLYKLLLTRRASDPLEQNICLFQNNLELPHLVSNNTRWHLHTELPHLVSNNTRWHLHTEWGGCLNQNIIKWRSSTISPWKVFTYCTVPLRYKHSGTFPTVSRDSHKP